MKQSRLIFGVSKVTECQCCPRHGVLVEFCNCQLVMVCLYLYIIPFAVHRWMFLLITELTWCQIMLESNYSLAVSAFYRLSNTDVSVLQEVENSAPDISSQLILLGGDFNLEDLRGSEKICMCRTCSSLDNKLKNVVETFCLCQYVASQ